MFAYPSRAGLEDGLLCSVSSEKTSFRSLPGASGLMSSLTSISSCLEIRSTHTHTKTEIERDKDTHTHRDRDRQSETGAHRETDRQTETDGQMCTSAYLSQMMQRT